MSILLGLALFSAAAAQQPVPAPVPPIRLDGPRVTPTLIVVRSGEARCGGAVERPVRIEPPLPSELSFVPMAWRTEAPTFRLRFRIDADGRPLSISEGTPNERQGQLNDLIPAFSVWRFAPGRERSDCEINFTSTINPVATVSLADLHHFVILGRPSQLFRAALRDRLTPQGSTCFAPSPAVRLRAYPAFDQIEQADGTASFALVGFDIDENGRPINVRLEEPGSNAELARQSVDAVRRSRFAAGGRRGCTYPYWRRGRGAIAAPPAPEPSAYRPADSNCSADGSQWAHTPQATFPPDFLTRGVEGWALVRYDVAPWGQTNNVQAVTAEPSDRFGVLAANIVRNARARPSPTGAIGCVDRVVFVLPDRDGNASGARAD